MQYRNADTDAFFEAILSLRDLDECYDFFGDACTIKEIVDFSQRYKVARLLTEKRSYQEINAQTGVSSATIGRVNRALQYGNGGYAAAIRRLGGEEAE
ncbi:MAG: YerC/YecD family TrpR-related protein [Oscillospiraceae bacterium]|nr:YerC/YecD family TrpR-related protein [Oscillospiraceae bacterium]